MFHYHQFHLENFVLNFDYYHQINNQQKYLSFVQYSFNGYAWGLADLFNTSTSAEASGTYLETVTSTYTIFRKHPADYTYLQLYKDGSNNPQVSSAWGTGSGYNESGPTLNLASGQFKSYTDSNPFFIRI